MKEIKLVLLDLYGTLIYSPKKINTYLNLFKETNIITYNQIKEARDIALTNNFNNLEEYLEKLKEKEIIQTYNKENLKFYENSLKEEISSIKLFPETKEVLQELKNRNKFLGLISNLASPYKKPVYDLGINQYFDRIIFSCDVKIVKPNPRIYSKINEEYNIINKNVLMVGDNEQNDFLIPKALGMNAFLLKRKNKENKEKYHISSLTQIFEYN